MLTAVVTVASHGSAPRVIAQQALSLYEITPNEKRANSYLARAQLLFSEEGLQKSSQSLVGASLSGTSPASRLTRRKQLVILPKSASAIPCLRRHAHLQTFGNTRTCSTGNILSGLNELLRFERGRRQINGNPQPHNPPFEAHVLAALADWCLQHSEHIVHRAVRASSHLLLLIFPPMWCLSSPFHMLNAPSTCSPPIVCSHASSCCLGRLLNVQLCCGFIHVIKSVEVGGEGCFNDCGQASYQALLQQKTSCDSILDPCLDARFACSECTLVRRSRDVSRSLVSSSSLACAWCGLRHTVFRETPEEPFERPLPHLVVDFCSPLFLKDCEAMHSQDVVDAANSQTLPEEGKFRLRVLSELDTFVHGANDIGLGRELVRGKLSWSDSDSECDASKGSCGDSGHVANHPHNRHCIQPDAC